MNNETLAVIDIEPESDWESTQSIQLIPNWLSAQEAFHRSKLKNKPAFQRAMKELTILHHFPAECISRGKARNTQYSEMAIVAISLVSADNLDELEDLRQKVVARSTSIVHIDRHNQASRRASVQAEQNLTTIATETSNLLGKFAQWGEALGDEAASQIEAAFTKKIADCLKKLTET